MGKRELKKEKEPRYVKGRRRKNDKCRLRKLGGYRRERRGRNQVRRKEKVEEEGKKEGK